MKSRPKQTSVAGAYSQIALHAAICLSMTLTYVDARPTDGGDESSKGELVVERQKQQIENACKEGKISALEAEFIGLVRREYASPQARMAAISAWREDNGHALDAEQDAKRAKLKPQQDARLASMRKHRKGQIREMKETGRIGAKEAELMSLLNQEFESPEVRQEAITAWQLKKGAALAAERDLKRASLKPLRDEQAENMRTARLRHVEEGIKSGRIGPVEGQLHALLARDYADAKERQEALQAWMTEKRTALESEKTARREANARGEKRAPTSITR